MILTGERREEYSGRQSEKEGERFLLERLVTAEPTRALVIFESSSNWHLQCENSSLCSLPRRHNAHKHQNLQRQHILTPNGIGRQEALMHDKYSKLGSIKR